MSQPITDYQSFFSGALQAIEDTANLKQEEDQLRSEEARTRTELEAEEKKLKADIDRSIKERLNEINRTYDGEISKAKDELKKAQAKREKARNQSVKARIAEETKGPLDEAAEKLRNMKEAFRKQHMPAFTTTRLYYSLFMPHRFKDFLLLVFLIVICFIAVPCAVYFLAVPEKWQIPVVMAGIYVAAILLFGGIYIGISNATKTPPGHMEMLRMGRDTWDEIRAARKTAKRIEQNIANETDDGAYDLAVYDDEIAQITQRLNEASRKKQEALTNFETVNRNIITDELTQNACPRIEQLSSDHAVAARRLQEVSSERQTRTLAMADDYEVYLGKENMTRERLQALSDIMAEGQVRNISEAVDEYTVAVEGQNTVGGALSECLTQRYGLS